MRIISIGEILWDVIGEEEHLGGAPLNFAAHAKKLGHDVFFISAVGYDERGDRALEAMAQMGLSTRFVRRVEEYATGVVTVTLDGEGQPRFVIHRPAAYDFPQLDPTDLEDLLSPPPDWIYFGTLLQMSPQARELTSRLITSKCGARHFYDVNLRSACYEPALVRNLISQATVVKLNDREVPVVDQMLGRSHRTLEHFCRDYAKCLGWEAASVTRGSGGCVLLIGNVFVEATGFKVKVADTIGAGDAFAAAFVHGLGSGWPAKKVADFANRVGALVASRPGALPHWTLDELAGLGD